tara:strand:+ start:82 stop:798 length:717 start_codon:yes stop_codon:yes gene_type:complete
MSCDLVVAGAIINDKNMIRQAIQSIPEHNYRKKYICLDGCPSAKTDDVRKEYQKYIDKITLDFPEFLVIAFPENIYFREMIQHICQISSADKLFVIQDDVVLSRRKSMNLDNIINDMDNISDMKVLSFPHRVISKDTHWFWLLDEPGKGEYCRCHGFSERVFLCDRLSLLKLCMNYPKSNKMSKRFIEFIYHSEMKSVRWKRMTDDERLEYRLNWGTYIHNNIIHKHLVGKRANIIEI